MSTVATHAPAAAGRPHIVHTRTQVTGLSLMAGAIVFLIAAAVTTGNDLGEAVFFALPIGLSALGAFLAWRFGTWSKAVGIFLALASGLVTFWIAFGLAEPRAFVEFTTATAWTVGLVLAVGGGIAALIHRTDVRTEASRTEQLVDRSALGLVVLALIVSLALWMTGRSTVDAAAAEGLPEIGIANFEFDGPATATAVDGQVDLVVRNPDAFVHTFTVDALGVDVTLLPGSSEVVSFAAAAGDTIAYYCKPHSSEAGAGEDDMAGTLTIE